MHSINSLRQSLGLTSANQVRNRIEAIKDLLLPHTRRGPNNQILLADDGADLLRRLQELHDSGLTMTEASEVLRAKVYNQNHSTTSVSPRFVPRDAKPDQTALLIASLREELAFLRQHVATLEQRLQAQADTPHEAAPWWRFLREEIDAP